MKKKESLGKQGVGWGFIDDGDERHSEKKEME